jgi:hypothetical protein
MAVMPSRIRPPPTWRERFGADFSGVRVHADSASQRLAFDLDARAFTQDRHIFLAAGNISPRPNPASDCLRNELTRIVQQGSRCSSGRSARRR